MADRGTLAVIAEQVGLAFGPLAVVVDSPAAYRDFVADLGWDFTTLPPELDTLREPVLAVAAFMGEEPISDEQSLDLLNAENVALEAITHLREEPGLPVEFRNEFPDQLIDYLIVEHLLLREPRWGYLLFVFGLIRLEEVPATAGRPAYLRRIVLLDQIGQFLSDPLGFFKTSYRWNQSDFEGVRLIQGMAGLLQAWDLQAHERLVDENTLAALETRALSPEGTYDTSLYLQFFETVPNPVRISAGIGLFLLPETATDKPGFALLPVASAGFDEPVGLAENLTLRFLAQIELTGGVGVLVRPNRDVSILAGLESGAPTAVSSELGVELTLAEARNPTLVLGHAEGTRLEVAGISTRAGARLGNAGFDVFSEFGFVGGKLVVRPSAEETDGLLAELLPASGLEVDFELIIGFSTSRGLYFSGSGGFEIILPVHLTIGPVEFVSARLAVHVDEDGSIPIELTGTITGDFSILKATVQNIGLKAALTFPPERTGNLGAADLAFGFRAPNGAGILVEAGPATGGGFLFLEAAAGRYAGALELSVFGVAVKAFGLIETKLPDGTAGLSFVIVIIAEFTPIQLGFGFTLLGVGGLIGINRTVDAQALGDAARTGSLAHLLFPTNVVQDAPAIIHDLATVFPAARGHFIVGPMAKLGWGTPTLISADLGILLEFPGPRIGLVGVVRMQLPSPDFTILSLQLAAAGLLDFPAKLFALDAGLFDSHVAGFTVTGDMAYRMGFGDNPTFLLSVGGFNPGFLAPPKFPELRRVSVDFGINGNPSLTASGYFALTSNTAQIGAKIELKASGYGIRLNGWLGFDVLFVFSPFSFTASISAGVRVSFHGVGLGITLRGSLSGPTPWHLNGRVCVSVLWWDACLPIDVTFGSRTPAALPEMNPWEELVPQGDPRLQVPRLRAAIVDARNWSGSAPPAGFSVVTLSEAASLERTPIDPMGAATLRQRVVPLNRAIEKFGEYRPAVYDHFDLSSVQLNAVDLNGDGVPDEIPYTVVKDKFAPGHFSDLTNAQKLSQESYQDMDAGISIAPELVRAGDAGSQTLMYETAFITETGERVSDPPFKITQEQLLAMLERSASALGGVRRAGVRRYMLPLDRPKKVTLQATTYVVADACSHEPNLAITPTGTTQSAALLALKAHLRDNPADRARFTIIPKRAA